MTSNIWFSSDWHLGHKSMLDYGFCNRKFDHLDDMAETIINNVNDVVMPKDELWLLGDIIWSSSYLYALDEINCNNIYLVRGNHDSDSVCRFHRWKGIYDYHRLKYLDKRFILFHFPIECWKGMERGEIHLHGHTHNNMSHKVQTLTNRFDVSVDACDMKPLNIQTILDRVENNNEHNEQTC